MRSLWPVGATGFVELLVTLEPVPPIMGLVLRVKPASAAATTEQHAIIMANVTAGFVQRNVPAAAKLVHHAIITTTASTVRAQPANLLELFVVSTPTAT